MRWGTSCLSSMVLASAFGCGSTTTVDSEMVAPRSALIGSDIAISAVLTQKPSDFDSTLVVTVTLVNKGNELVFTSIAGSFPVMLRLFTSDDTSSVAAFNNLTGKGGNRSLQNITIRPNESALVRLAIPSDELRLANLGIGPYRGVVTLRTPAPFSIDVGDTRFSPLR